MLMYLREKRTCHTQSAWASRRNNGNPPSRTTLGPRNHEKANGKTAQLIEHIRNAGTMHFESIQAFLGGEEAPCPKRTADLYLARARAVLEDEGYQLVCAPGRFYFITKVTKAMPAP